MEMKPRIQKSIRENVSPPPFPSNDTENEYDLFDWIGVQNLDIEM